MATQKRHHGEEAERVTLADCAAANLTIALLNSGQLKPEDILVPAPIEPPLATLVYDKPVSYYQRAIATMPSARGYDPRHIEGYMRLQHDTLSRLTKRQFSREVRLCVACIVEGGLDAAERNAQSFGL